MVDQGANICNNYGIDAFFPIVRELVTKEDAKNHDNAYRNLADTAEQVFRVLVMA